MSSSTTTTQPIPDIPEGFSITPGIGSNTASWDAADNADTYNLYWKKDKIPNCYFNNFNDWTVSTKGAGETAEISGNTLVCDLPDSSDTNITCARDFVHVLDEDIIFEVDLLSYAPDSSTDGFLCVFKFYSSPGTGDSVAIRRMIYGGEKRIASRYEINGATNFYVDVVATDPIRFKIERSGTAINTYYDIGGGYVLVHSGDFGSRVSNLTKIALAASDQNSRGGSCIFDNFVVTPSVIDDYDGVINNIVDLTYDHNSLTPGDVYCYELTAENPTGESDASLEDYGVPTTTSTTTTSSTTTTTYSSSSTTTSTYSTSSTSSTTTSTQSTESTTTTSSTASTSSSTSTTSSSTISTTSSTSLSTSTSTSTISSTTTTTALCEYDDYFSSLDNWTITEDDEYADVSLVSNTMRMAITNGQGSYCTADYDYLIASGDFDVRIALDNYTTEDTTDSLKVMLYVGADYLSQAPDNQIYIRAYRNPSNYTMVTNAKINGVFQGEQSDTYGTYPTQLRIKRTGTTLYTYYAVLDTWYLVYSWDFSSYASTLDSITIYTICDNHGGSIDCDDLKFVEGCPTP